MLNNECFPNGVIYCQQRRTQDLNDRIFSRNIPYLTNPVRYSTRSVGTKYSIMPIISSNDDCKNINVKDGYNADLETVLQNRHFALQRSELNEYVPSSTSSLYNDYIPEKTNSSNPHPFLNNVGQKPSFNPNKYNLGGQRFNNATRNQLLNIKY
tara:strand:- start:176 stop:637 length:462 start_codon:yes stop_codon:yes gene_type:complete